MFTNRYEARGDVDEHAHGFFEIVVIGGGRGIHQSIYGSRELGRGDAILLRPGAWHAYRECEGLVVLNLCVTAGVVARELQWAVEDPGLRALLWADTAGLGDSGTLRLDDASTAACEQLLDALRSDDVGTGLRARSVGRLLVLLGILLAHADRTMLASFDRVGRARPWTRAAADLLRDRHAQNWQLGDLASSFAVDPAYFARTFKAAFGQPPMAYLARVRAERAATLLLSTDLPMARVGAEVGWPDPNYFARRFRAHFGHSPTEYRAQHRT